MIALHALQCNNKYIISRNIEHKMYNTTKRKSTIRQCVYH